MATAGTPLRATPVRNRRARMAFQLGAAATPRVQATTRSWEIAMIGLRPRRSDRAPTRIRARARPMVAPDTARLAAAGLTPNARVNSGSSGCTE